MQRFSLRASGTIFELLHRQTKSIANRTSRVSGMWGRSNWTGAGRDSTDDDRPAQGSNKTCNTSAPALLLLRRPCQRCEPAGFLFRTPAGHRQGVSIGCSPVGVHLVPYRVCPGSRPSPLDCLLNMNLFDVGFKTNSSLLCTLTSSSSSSSCSETT